MWEFPGVGDGRGKASTKRNEGKKDFIFPSPTKVERGLNRYVPEKNNYSQALCGL